MPLDDYADLINSSLRCKGNNSDLQRGQLVPTQERHGLGVHCCSSENRWVRG